VTDDTTMSDTPPVDVAAAFLLPHVMLEPVDAMDSPEVKRIKMCRNANWLKRWLPTYVIRWLALTFLTAALSEVTALCGAPALILWLFEFIQYVCVGVVISFGVKLAKLSTSP